MVERVGGRQPLLYRDELARGVTLIGREDEPAVGGATLTGLIAAPVVIRILLSGICLRLLCVVGVVSVVGGVGVVVNLGFARLAPPGENGFHPEYDEKRYAEHRKQHAENNSGDGHRDRCAPWRVGTGAGGDWTR